MTAATTKTAVSLQRILSSGNRKLHRAHTKVGMVPSTSNERARQENQPAWVQAPSSSLERTTRILIRLVLAIQQAVLLEFHACEAVAAGDCKEQQQEEGRPHRDPGNECLKVCAVVEVSVVCNSSQKKDDSQRYYFAWFQIISLSIA